MRLRTIACALTTATLLTLSTGSATATTEPTHLQKLAQQQTKLLLEFYQGQNVSPPKCGQGQGSDGIDGVFLLPVLSFAPGDRTLTCKTRARSVLVDLGGGVIMEDPRSTYKLLDGRDVSFTRENLEPICNDLIARGRRGIGVPMPAKLDGHRLSTGPALNSGVFTGRVNPGAVIPGEEEVDLYADSEALGHPGRLATVFCGYKAKVHLRPGTHTIVVNYSELFGGSSTVFTYNITVKG